MILISWMFTSLFVIPPYMDIFGMLRMIHILDICSSKLSEGRFGLEPGGTSCTIDYWHGNFRNYNYYVLYLVILAYMLPISAM